MTKINSDNVDVLRESKQRYRSLFENSNDAIFIHDDQGHILDVNQRAMDMLGYTREELLALPMIDCYQLDAVDDATASFNELVKMEYVRFNSKFRKKDSLVIDVEITMRLIESVHAVFQALVRDITESKRLEDVLRKSTHYLDNIINSTGEPIFVKDDNSRFILANDALCKMLGIERENIIGKTLVESLPKDQMEHFLEADKMVLKSGQENLCEESLTGHDGKILTIVTKKTRYVNEQGNTFLVGVIHDITERKQAEKKLKSSEIRYRRLFESAKDGILILDAETGMVVDANPFLIELMGFSHDQLLGKKVWELGFLKDIIANFDNFLELQQKEYIRYDDLPLKTVDGRHIDVEFISNVYHEDNKNVIQCNIRDITERKQAENALLEKEDKYRNLVDNANEAIIVAQDGLLKFVNSRTLELTGYSELELTTKPFPEFIHPADRNLVVENYKNRLKGDPVTPRYIFRLLTKEGISKWVEIGVVLIKWKDKPATLNFISDITERRRAEVALRESEERYQRITEAITDYIYTVRVTDECAVETVHGPGCLAVTGYRAKEFANDPILWYRMVAAEDRPKVEEQARLILAGEDPPPIEHRIVHKKGKVLWVRNTFVPHYDERGALLSYDGLIQDITERKQAEEEREKLEAQLLQAQKMEAVGRLAGGVAHDFNNMLSIILGHAELAMSRIEPADPLYTALEEIQNAGKRSADLTRQLLTFARKQTVAPVVLDLNETIEGMLKMLRRLMGEDIALSWNPGHNLRQIKIDPSQIDQILANLCVNARDAIADVGKVIIDTANVTFDEAFCSEHADFTPGDFVMLTISDNGCGMDKVTMLNIFEPFFTTKVIGKGTGLGLSTVYGIVKQNSGFITVYSEPGEGTIFKIYLPQYVGKDSHIFMEGDSEAIIGGTETILLVEDEPAILKLGKIQLEQLGYMVLATSTTKDAIRLAGEYKGQIHLLITDVVMPEMNGRDLANRLLSLYPNIKRLFMSGYTADVIAHHGVLDEGVYFIQKPFSLKELACKVREALEQR